MSGMFMAGVGGMGGAGQDLISSCSSMSYSGDELDFVQGASEGNQDCAMQEWEKVRGMLVGLGHFDLTLC